MNRTTLLVITFALAVGGAAWRSHIRAAEFAGASAANPAASHFPPIPSPTSSRKIDEYGNIRWSDERMRLDNFAIELHNTPAATGYIVCYGGRRGRTGEARRRCDRAVKYAGGLFRGTDAARLVTLDGGYREDLTVELWVLPSGSTPPQPSPTVDPGEVRFIKAAPKRRARRR